MILVHAVNCQGVMGSGIAKEFKQRFPEAFKLYKKDCMDVRVGQAKIYHTENPDTKMGCLFTSDNYGALVDTPTKIGMSTMIALEQFFEVFKTHGYLDDAFKIYSNKFNSGLFNVPWKTTEALIKVELKKHPGVTWTVCSPF